MLSSSTANLRSLTPILVSNGFPIPSRSLTAADALDRLSEALDLIEVHDQASAHVATLAGAGALVAFDAATAVRHHRADGGRLGEVDAQELAVDGLSACGGILRAIVALGDSEVAAIARECAEDCAGAMLGLREVPRTKLS